MSPNKFVFVIWTCLLCVSLVRGLIGTCARRRRYDCLPHTIDKSNCPPQCNKCPVDFPLVRHCQTPHRACIFKNKNVFTGITSQASCESVAGGVWCNGDSQQICVETQPIREECFNRINKLTPCHGHSTIQSCHLNGCFWCDVGPITSKNRCFRNDQVGVCRQDTCCFKDTCLAGNFTVQECSQRCCDVCIEGSLTRCNFPGIGSVLVDQNSWSNCTRKCGCGTQYRLVNCTNKFDASTCKKQFRSCNTQDCKLPTGYCSYGVRARYNDNTMCCVNHTFACGRNRLNENIHHRRMKRVVGGTNVTDPYLWHWVGVVYTGSTNTSTNQKCTVTLVGDRWVVTTEKCVGTGIITSGDLVRDGLVHLGIPNRALRPKHQSKISEIFRSNKSDVLIIKLTIPVPPGDPHISPICLPNGEMPLPDRRCVVVGWGRYGPNSSCSAVLKEGNIKVLPWRMCMDAWGLQLSGYNNSHYICAGIPEGEIDACAGDEGGPLMCQRCENCGWYMAGVATRLLGCGVKAKPSVYLKMTGCGESFVNSVFPALDNSTYTSCPPIYSI